VVGLSDRRDSQAKNSLAIKLSLNYPDLMSDESRVFYRVSRNLKRDAEKMRHLNADDIAEAMLGIAAKIDADLDIDITYGMVELKGSEDETWKRLPEWPYDVSTLGRVRRLETGRILKQFKNESGYLIITLCRNGKRKTFQVHRLVADVFIANPSNLPIVMHVDNNPSNNNADNLRWGTHINNQHDRIKVDGIMGSGALLPSQILEIRKSHMTIKELSTKYHVDRVTIASIRSGKTFGYVKDSNG